jgi:signal transduction histidine kinase
MAGLFTTNLLGTVLPIIIVVNLLFSGMIYFHGTRRWTEIFYALTSVFAGLWTIGTLMLSQPSLAPNLLPLAAIFHYIGGNLAYMSIFWFSVFNREQKNQNLIFAWIVSGANILVDIWVFLFPQLFYEVIASNSLSERIIFHFPGYAVFVIVLSILFLQMLANVALEYNKAKKGEELPIKYILYATSIGGGLGIILNLYFPWFGNFDFFTFNPIFVTLFFTGISFYTLLKYQLFNIKVITVELLTFIIWIFLFMQALLSDTGQEGILSWILLVLTVIFGIFLIRSILKEVENREKIKKLADDITVANKELERVSAAKSDFLSIASHQLKTPLSIVKGYISMLLEGSMGHITDALKPQLQKVYLSNERLISVVEDLLNLSRIEEKRMKYNFRDMDLGELVQGVVKEFIAESEKKHNQLIWKKPEQTIISSIDIEKIRNVVFNLMDNALRYTENGNITVSIEPYGSQVNIIITDTGQGIDQDHLRRIFKQYTRLKTGKRDFAISGFGLGIYIGNLIIQNHGGSMSIVSPGVGKGTTAVVTLPIKKS